jgi:hypothetical protein
LEGHANLLLFNTFPHSFFLQRLNYVDFKI